MKKSLLAVLTSLSLLVPSFAPALAQTVPTDSLIKASGPAVYWYSSLNGRRYTFPNTNTFYSWFGPSDFYRVNIIPDAQLAMIRIGGNVTYRPGSRLVKITTDPRVYAVDNGQVLRPLASEGVATNLYGEHWQQFIDDVPDAFFTNYSIGAMVSTTTDYHPSADLTPNALIR